MYRYILSEKKRMMDEMAVKKRELDEARAARGLPPSSASLPGSAHTTPFKGTTGGSMALAAADGDIRKLLDQVGGLHKLNPVVTHSSKAPCLVSQPLA